MSDEQVRELFEQHGKVDSVDITKDRQTGRPRGFAFVDMPDENEGQKAIEALHEFESEGRNLNVNEARPREDRSQRRGGYGGGGGRNRW